VSAQILPFTRPLGDEVEIAWALHRACLRAEMHDPELLHDPAHVKARTKAHREFERLYEQWSRQ
jgi:hypothetical protein